MYSVHVKGIMSSIPVPDFYRRSIMVDLDITQSREEAQVQCRQQLCVSHTLGSVEDAYERELQGIQRKNSSCKAFSIRGYVMNVREKDKCKCWPFRPHLLQRTTEALPPLDVPTFRYWECLECLDNEFNLDNSEKGRNYQQKPDYLTDTIIISDYANSPAKPSDDVNGYLEVAQYIAIDERSAETRVETHNEIYYNEDGVASHSPTRQSTSHKALEGDNLYSVNNIIAHNANALSTDSEEKFDSKQSFCSMDKDQILSYYRSNQLTAEPDISSIMENTDQLIHMPGTMNTVSKSDEKILPDNHENGTAHEAMKKFGHEIQEDKTSALPIVDNVDKEVCITKQENDGILTDVKKHSVKRQYGKGKTLKKRLISDLISVTPVEQNTVVNWNDKVKQLSVTAKTDMWRVSKTASNSLKKFKSPDNLHLESVYVRKKRQCKGSSFQSSSTKTLKEPRRVIERHFGPEKLDSPQKEIVSNTWKNKVLFEELTQNELDRQTFKDPVHNLLDDLACFMAKNQYERYATTPRSSSLEQTVNLKDSTVQNKEAEGSNCFVTEKLDKLDISIQPHRRLSLKEDLVKGTGTSISTLNKPSSVDGQVCLLVEDGMKFNQVQGSCRNEKQEISGQGMEAEAISITMIGSSSSSDHHACNNTQMVNRKQENEACTESVSDRDRIGDVVIVEAMENDNSSTFQRKSTNNLECFLRNSQDQLSIIEQHIGALQDKIHSFSSTDIKGYTRGSYGSVPSDSCKDTLYSHNNGLNRFMYKSPCKGTKIDTALTVEVNAFGPVQTNAAEASATTQTAVQSSLAPNVLTILDNSESSNLRAAYINQTERCPEPNRAYVTSSEGYNPPSAVSQPPIADKTVFTKQKLMSTGRDLTFENSGGSFQHVKNQVSQKEGTCVAEPNSTFPVLDTSAQQPPEILSGASPRNPDIEYMLPNNRTFQHSFDTLDTSSSLGTEPPADAVSISSTFVQGNKLDSQTTLSQETFDRGKFQLLSHIEKRIQSYCPTKTTKSTVANEAEKGPQHVEFQTAVSLDPNTYVLNKNPADFMGLGSSLPKKRQVGYRKTIAIIGLSAGKHSIKNMEDTQVQADNNMAPHIIPSFSQANALGRSEETTLKILDEQNCRMEMLEEVSRGHTNSKTTIPGKNMKMSSTLENAHEEILGSMSDKGKQTQMEIQTSEPGPVGQSQTSVRGEKNNYKFKITLRSGKSLDSTCLTKKMPSNDIVLQCRRLVRKAGNKEAKTKRRKRVRKAEIKAIITKRKGEQSRSIQIETCTTDNHTKPDNISVNQCSQDLPSSAEHVFGYNHVLNPTTQTNQKNLLTPSVPFPAHQFSKEAAEVRKAEIKAIITKRKGEQSRSIQIETCTTDNHTKPDNISVNQCSQDLPSSAEHVFGYNHVLNPTTQNNQKNLLTPSVPFPAHQFSKEAAEARMKLTELKTRMMGSEKKQRNQPLAIPPNELQAIENYIKWGIFSLDPPFSKGLPTNLAESVKPGPGPLHHSTPGQNGKILNSPKPSIHLNPKMSGTISSTRSLDIPSCAGNANVGIPLNRSNGNGETVIQSYAGNSGNIGTVEGAGYMQRLLRPLGPSEQHALLPQIQAYLDKSHKFSSSTGSVSNFSSPEDNLMTKFQIHGDSFADM